MPISITETRAGPLHDEGHRGGQHRLHVLLDGIAFHLLGGLVSGEESEVLVSEHLASRWR